jgi:plasmid maintenance system antidote protein VapI
LIHGRRKLTVEMSLWFARCFGTSDKFWVNIQVDIDLRNARESPGAALNKIEPVIRSA